MSKRVCPVVNCPEFMPCAKHARTTGQRGYGPQHRREREQWARIHLTDRQFPNLPVPFAFTMLLRKHLEGSRLLRVE